MRKSKIINIEGVGEVTVKEISPYAAYKAFSSEDKAAELETLVKECIDLPIDKLKELYGSELEQIVDGIMDVNASFLAIAEKIGVKSTVMKVVQEVLDSLPMVFAGAFKEAIETPGITDGKCS